MVDIIAWLSRSAKSGVNGLGGVKLGRQLYLHAMELADRQALLETNNDNIIITINHYYHDNRFNYDTTTIIRLYL
jgi:hypothetical protein